MMYVPDLENYTCVSVIDKDTVRAYTVYPVLDSTVSYRDYYVNSHYMYKDGSEYIESVPDCMGFNTVSDDIYYRNDLSDILVIFIIMFFIMVVLPYKLISRLFGRWFKL